jgi:hypothetical protein
MRRNINPFVILPLFFSPKLLKVPQGARDCQKRIPLFFFLQYTKLQRYWHFFIEIAGQPIVDSILLSVTFSYMWNANLLEFVRNNLLRFLRESHLH